ncbi:glycosyltransferase [Deinococcus radiotolerans]|uniref:Glycosyl transferase group 1 n=1 Tax=Deinococcus radiotolerans TaxID=1309407 RepID=A0ABQ2FM59_9DEIO|nr:glycosyltransferase [Deinococcus radiotolerans]GGL09622.1 hypothetical protein GCM10010844_30390 [Deinococcus radiotolerans]
MKGGRTALFLPGLHGGGAERVMVQLAASLAARGQAVDLVVASAVGPYLKDVPPQVRLVDLRAGRVVLSLPRLVAYLRRTRPRVLLSTLEHANVAAVLAGRMTGVPVVLREANVLHRSAAGLRARLLPALMRAAYPRAQHVVAVSGSVAQSLRTLGVPPGQVSVIDNPVITAQFPALLAAPLDDPWFQPGSPPVVLGAGRLELQKDFATLIRAFAQVRAARPARLIILGEGQDRGPLEALIHELGVQDDVRLPGFRADILAFMARAHTFALTSQFEGLPGTLIQALAAGCAAVATDAPGGSREVLQGGSHGHLVPVGDVSALASALHATLDRPRPGPPGGGALDRYREEVSAEQYVRVLDRAAAGNPPGCAERHLALLVTSLSYGGAQTQVVELARRFRARGWRVTLLSMLPPEAFEEDLRRSGIEVVSLNMRRGVPSVRAWWQLVRWLRRERPSTLHSHMVHANLLARLARRPGRVGQLICTAHNIIEGGRTRELAYRLTDPWCDLTTNVSRAATQRYVQVGAVPAGQILYVPNGVDPATFRPDPRRRHETRAALKLGGAFTWLAVGRFEDAKDYPNLLRAFAQVQAGAPGAQLLLVGDGPTRPAAQAQVRDLGLNAHVQFLGLRGDVPALMNAADGYVLSSRWEGLPMVLLEALASGLPIVTTDVGGTRELVRPGGGLLVPPMDSGALARAMLHLMTLPAEQRARWSEQGLHLMQEEYAIDEVVRTWEGLYESRAGGHHA